MTTVLIKFWPKNTQIRHLQSLIYAFSLFHKILQIDRFEGADFKYDNSFLKFLPKNTQIRHFWSQIQAFSLFHKILRLDKFEGADFKCDNSSYKILAQKYPNKAFLIPNLGIFISLQKNCNQKISRVLISNMTIVLIKFWPRNTQARHLQSQIQAF